MPQPPTNDDYEAESDLNAIVRAKEIEADESRMARAKRFAEKRKNEFAEVAASLPGKAPSGFDGAVRGSRMRTGR